MARKIKIEISGDGESKYNIKNNKRYTTVLREWLDCLLSRQLIDVLMPNKVPDIEMEYNEYMYKKAVSEIKKHKNLSLVFLAEANEKTLTDFCKERNLNYNPIRRKAEAEAYEVFDTLKVYENLILKVIGWD